MHCGPRDRPQARRGRSAMKRTVVIGLSLTTSALAVLGERDAAACGGCFHPPAQTASDITDERMLLSASTAQSTLYDQIRYAGSPTSFAWVLPIHGTVDVGLSADVLFDSIDALTATQIVPPYPNCPPPPNCGRRLRRSTRLRRRGRRRGRPDRDGDEGGERRALRDRAAAFDRFERPGRLARARTDSTSPPTSCRSSTSTSPRGSTSWR